MKKKRFIILGSILLSSLLCVSVLHAEEELKKRQLYLGIGPGISNLDPNTTGSSRVDDSVDLGVKVFGGFDITDRFSLEAYYSDLGEAKFSSPTGSLEYKSFGANVVYYFYKKSEAHVGWGAFGRLGLGRMKNSSSNVSFVVDNDNHIMVGAGIEYAWRNGLAVRADIDLYDKDANLYGLYLLKRFGGKKRGAREATPIMAPVDSDGDGVLDPGDACPNTAAGAKVNEKGCEQDSDGDSVVDSADFCLNTPPGTVVDRKGCEPDTDADGVVDSLDVCPNTAFGVEVDFKGCQLDSDDDGVVDSVDLCPNTPMGVAVDRTGCESVSDKDGIVLENVTFATDSAELISHSLQVLNEIRDLLKRHSDMKIEVAGHADERGTREYNLDLSQKRAESVRNYLIKQGISDRRMTAKGYGYDKPIEKNKTMQGLAANRRVEIHILE